MTKFKLLKKVTKAWKSGITTLAVIGDGEHQDRNYIILERVHTGHPEKTGKFNLYLDDWNHLKELIESETYQYHQWPTSTKYSTEQEVLHNLNEILASNPDFLQKILSNKNVAGLSQASFEALDKLAVRVYEIKAENVDFLLKQLSDAKNDELDNFVAILNELRIGQISTIAELVRKKISLIKLLGHLIKQKDTKEREIHKLLEKNLWLLDNNYDLVRSDKTLSDYLDKNLEDDPELGKRPDLIVKMFLQDSNHVVLVELKRPSVKIKADHIGQILGYKGIIERHNHDIKVVDIFLLGYDLDPNMPTGLRDLKIDVLENIINKKRNEFDEFLKIVEDNKEHEFEIL
ncbi:MAG: hypothetical protein RB292_00555 [Patescibacteria group bacterium]|jgi:hypothetical protein|nr:hypothetical protein [Patescibacteria group bacterium]